MLSSIDWWVILSDYIMENQYFKRNSGIKPLCISDIYINAKRVPDCRSYSIRRKVDRCA